MAKMKPHYHEDEYMYIVDAKDAFVTYGPTKETTTTREPLHAGEIIRAKDGEWHLFDFDSEDGFLSIIAFFGGTNRSHKGGSKACPFLKP